MVDHLLLCSPTFLRIIRVKSVQHFKPDPYLAAILNCAMWVFYGMPFVHPDSLLVVMINGFGLFIEAVYIAIFFTYFKWSKKRRMIVVLLVEIIFFVGVMLITLYAFHTTKARIVSKYSFSPPIVMLLFALDPTTKHGDNDKNVKFMPFWLSVANGVVWLIYALIKIDPWIA
ncbi:Bidirectional sugar transporter SWEET5-like protein, partial [Drosera capensis]